MLNEKGNTAVVIICLVAFFVLLTVFLPAISGFFGLPISSAKITDWQIVFALAGLMIILFTVFILSLNNVGIGTWILLGLALGALGLLWWRGGVAIGT
jgi:hypothetical protein